MRLVDADAFAMYLQSEEKKDVMVTVRDSFDGTIFVAIDSYWGGEKNGEWFSFDNDVVAWAEIPNAYEVKHGSD